MNWSDDLFLALKRCGLAAAVCGGVCGCAEPPSRSRTIEPKYDAATGRLVQVTVDAIKDNKPNIFSYMDGTSFVRIEIDADEDGKIDRWEHYGPDQKLERVGISRSNDGVADAWLFSGADGTVSRIDVSTKRNGVVNRKEFYAKGSLARVEEDTDADGLIDKWETYADGVLATAAFDTRKSGKPTVTLDYRSGGR